MRIAGYAFNAEMLDPRCTLEKMGVTTVRPIRGDDAELTSAITCYGFESVGLMLDDPRWQDSTVIPQPVFENEVPDGECCGVCLEVIE